MWQSFNHLDRRWIFLAMLLAVMVPLLLGFSSPGAPSPETKAVFDAIENLPDGSLVGIGIDYDPASEAELQPMAIAFIRHCVLKRHKMIFLTLWPTASPVIDRVIRQVIEKEFADRQLKYGVDYVSLGYHPGEQVAIPVLVSDFRKSKSRDDTNQSLDSLPLTKDLRGLKELDLLLDVSAGFPGAKEWAQYAGATTGLPVAAGSVGVQVPQLLPYLPAPLIGLVAALRGAVEYETLMTTNYETVRSLSNIGQRRMGPQLWAHLLIISLIIWGNVIQWSTRKPGGSS